VGVIEAVSVDVAVVVEVKVGVKVAVGVKVDVGVGDGLKAAIMPPTMVEEKQMTIMLTMIPDTINTVFKDLLFLGI